MFYGHANKAQVLLLLLLLHVHGIRKKRLFCNLCSSKKFRENNLFLLGLRPYKISFEEVQAEKINPLL